MQLFCQFKIILDKSNFNCIHTKCKFGLFKVKYCKTIIIFRVINIFAAPYLCNLVLHGAIQTFPCFLTTTRIWSKPTGTLELAHHLRETSAECTESSSSMRSFLPPDLTIQPTQALRLRAPCLFTIMILSCVHKHTSPKCFSSRAGNFFHLPSLLFLPLPIATHGSLSPSSTANAENLSCTPL